MNTQFLCIIGLGHMGSGIADIIIEKGIWPLKNLILCDLLPQQLKHFENRGPLTLTTKTQAAVQKSQIVLLSIRPQEMKPVLTGMQDIFRNDALLVSVAAGITVRQIGDWSRCQKIIRAMPNLPARLGYGMTGWTATPQVTKMQRCHFQRIVGQLGVDMYFAEENFLNVITALSGSGPMYFAYITSELAKIGVKMGLTLQEAQTITKQTLLGASMMLTYHQLDPGEFVGQVASRGGTTEQALIIFEKQGLGRIIENAVQSAYHHAISTLPSSPD